jgi:hypothetical protein
VPLAVSDRHDHLGQLLAGDVLGAGHLLGREHTRVMLHLKRRPVVTQVLLQPVLAGHTSHCF